MYITLHCMAYNLKSVGSYMDIFVSRLGVGLIPESFVGVYLAIFIMPSIKRNNK